MVGIETGPPSSANHWSLICRVVENRTSKANILKRRSWRSVICLDGSANLLL